MLELNSAPVGFDYAYKSEPNKNIENAIKAITPTSDDVEAHNARGIAYSKNEDQDRAIATFSKAIELKPDFAEAYNNRGVAYSKKGEYDLAIKDLSTAIEFRSDDTVGSIFYYNRGYAYRKKGKYVCAIEDYTKAIELTPNYAAAYYNRGEAWLHLEKWEKAKSDLTTSRDRGVDIIAAFYNDHENVEVYERANRVKLPADIAVMLTPHQKEAQKQTSKNPMAQRIIEAVEQSYDVTMEDAEALLQVIKENQMPMRFDSPFEANK